MSDHQDAHLAKLHPECDIGDLWAFHNGRGHRARVVFVMTLNAGNVGLVHYGPRSNRNARLYTTVPKRFLHHVRNRRRVHAGGLLAEGDLRRQLTGRLRFHPDAVYEFRIAKPDEDGVLRPATSFKIVFQGEGGIPEGRRRPQRQSMELLKAVADRGDHVERGDRSGKEIVFDREPVTMTSVDPQGPTDLRWFSAPTTHGPIQLFAGPRQDPFTFDFEGVRTLVANQFRKELCASGGMSGGNSDAFSRAFNISAIVLEVPIQEILTDAEIDAGTTFGAWSATTLDGHPINRAGWPLYKPTFLPKHDFEGILDPTNGTRLEHQRELFEPLLRESLGRLGVPPETEDDLIDLVVPDALPIDVHRAAGLDEQPPNGRTLDASGDPTRYFINYIEPGAYRGRRRAKGRRPPRFRPLDHFPYLTAPSADPQSRGSSGWTDFVPIPDPPWPPRNRDWREPSSCDDYLDGQLDPTQRQPGPRPPHASPQSPSGS